MSNDPKTDLIYAILAMDSYNRGYGSGIKNLKDDLGLKIGNFSVFDHSNNAVGSNEFTAGFYAIAYKNATTGETVIAYRGTDVKGLSASATMGGSDPLNGYS
jgi:hypothetical protein